VERMRERCVGGGLRTNRDLEGIGLRDRDGCALA
jgi:hypothetical protein